MLSTSRLQTTVNCVLIMEHHDGTGATYFLEELKDFTSLAQAHATYQARAMSAPSPPPAIVVAPEHPRVHATLPAVVTAYVAALLLKRLLLLSENVLQYIELPFSASWQQYNSLYKSADTFFIDCGSPARHRNSSSALGSLAVNHSSSPRATVLIYSSTDYDIPLLHINPTISHLLHSYFPDRELFHTVAKHLFKPARIVFDGMQPYLATTCIVGLEIQCRKQTRRHRSEWSSLHA